MSGFYGPVDNGGGSGGGGDVNVIGGTLDAVTEITNPITVDTITNPITIDAINNPININPITVDSITNPIDVNFPVAGFPGATITAGLFHGSKTVPTVTATSVGNQSSITGVLISSRSSNSAAIYLGGDDTVTTSTGIELLPGASVKIAVLNVGSIYCISGTAAQVLNFLVQ